MVILGSWPGLPKCSQNGFQTGSQMGPTLVPTWSEMGPNMVPRRGQGVHVWGCHQWTLQGLRVVLLEAHRGSEMGPKSLDSKLDFKMDSKNIDSKIDSKTDSNLDSKIDFKMDSKLDSKMDSKWIPNWFIISSVWGLALGSCLQTLLTKQAPYNSSCDRVATELHVSTWIHC